ncbi:MAG: DUF4278 domain-containing protein [Cyanobacteria bacterium CRU_2_1]|nr:DUF4278 domain-containing protein [Cyanobacteria bacterium RU_5_0]NJR63779.1 DUF4278 domain-containing protein [Cyanobacteria bacterium CRU_2_1]
MDFFTVVFNTLAIAIALILLIIGLFSAPWQVLLLILVLGLLGSRWLIGRSHLQGVLEETSDVNSAISSASNDQPATSEPARRKLLSYRGASYKPSTPSSETSAETDRVEVSGKYRGGIWKSPH